MSPNGIFEWKRRMGVHLAYHQSSMNRLIHFICFPCQLIGLLKLLSLLPSMGEWDVSLLLIIALSPIFILPEMLSGMLMVVLFMGLRFVALELPGSWVGLLMGVLFFAISFTIQTEIGHKVFEENGRDDTEKNINELLETKNPIPFLLVFYYHVLNLLLLFGYRPKLKEEIEIHLKEEQSHFEKES